MTFIIHLYANCTKALFLSEVFKLKIITHNLIGWIYDVVKLFEMFDRNYYFMKTALISNLYKIHLSSRSTSLLLCKYFRNTNWRNMSFDNVSRWKQLKNVTVGLLMVWQNTRLWHFPTYYIIITCIMRGKEWVTYEGR